MEDVILWKGMATGFYPNPVRLDALIGKRIAARGYLGSRQLGKCTFATTSRAHAEQYADNTDQLKIVTLQPGVTLTWCVGKADLVLEFSKFLNAITWTVQEDWWALKSVKPLISDVQGDIDTLESYLREGRQKRAISAIIDRFLSKLEFGEVIYDTQDALKEALGDHAGEVWITGACDLQVVPQEAAASR